jgi:hypothetical protein
MTIQVASQLEIGLLDYNNISEIDINEHYKKRYFVRRCLVTEPSPLISSFLKFCLFVKSSFFVE